MLPKPEDTALDALMSKAPVAAGAEDEEAPEEAAEQKQGSDATTLLADIQAKLSELSKLIPA